MLTWDDYNQEEDTTSGAATPEPAVVAAAAAAAQQVADAPVEPAAAVADNADPTKKP